MQALFVNADITTLDPAHPSARALLVADGRIELVLDQPAVGLSKSVRVIDCQGGWLVPGFHDCHVHLTATGLLAGERNLRACADLDGLLRRVGDLARGQSMVYAGNYEESGLLEQRAPTINELDAIAPRTPVLLSRVDGHSCVMNSAAFASLQLERSAAGVEKDDTGTITGRVFGPDSYAVQLDFVRRLPQRHLRKADREAAQMALAAGITTLHNVIEGDASYEELAEIYIDNGVLALHVIPKSCSTNVAKIRRLGGRLFGGDIFVDGSIGSRTAAVAQPYADRDGCGLLYLKRDQLAELFSEAAEAGLSLGVHAIGDQAIEETIAAWESVAKKRGALGDLRPSIDHFEIARPDHIARSARLGLALSMQPAFDYLWGGEHGMYEQRLGKRRAAGMNLIGSARRAGCVVCAGSDSPVTALSPLLGVHSAVNHNVAAERLTVLEALACYTCDAAKLSFNEGRNGRLRAGMAADLTLLERRLDEVPAQDIKDVNVLMTVVDGDVRFAARG
ncbi:MAG: amidohydrolase [Candidatus Eremiobacteraeota bacterium]|nr:amidohydrolase [Candidatus Eremiobacteraeota bacterium]